MIQYWITQVLLGDPKGQMLIGMPYERRQYMTSRRLFSQVMKSLPLILTGQEGGEGLEGTHKSDMEESEEREDLEMIWQRMTKRKTLKIQKKFGGFS